MQFTEHGLAETLLAAIQAVHGALLDQEQVEELAALIFTGAILQHRHGPIE